MILFYPVAPVLDWTQNEDVCQQKVITWINENIPYYRDKIIRIKNEEPNKVRLMQEIGKGLHKGAADNMIRTPTALHPNLWVEFKNAKGSQGPEQKKFQARCEEWGDAYMIVGCQKDFEQLAMYLWKLSVKTKKKIEE